ncbi:MAG: SDR family NAD(P)-dependent oxidoreductase [Candidatus Aminicenantes bacterium]|nr:SDR family NAD(P)-dependent oxidoreductase [Candidatus Aminicenantes bacterium]
MNIAEKALTLISLEGKVALVTGAASGIGRGIAGRLAEMGATVVLLDIDEKKGAEAAAEIIRKGGRAGFVKCDVRSDADCRRTADGAGLEFGRIDILCNNAGVAIRKNCLDLEEEEWDRAVDIMLKGVYLLSRRVIPHMIKAGGGSIINTGSGWSLKGGPDAVSYCAAKGGILNMTRAMAIDHGRHNIRVNCVCPGDVDTPMLRGECLQLGENMDAFMKDAATRPIARVGTPEDVANAVLFLAGNLSTWVTGTHLVVDGGGIA